MIASSDSLEKGLPWRRPPFPFTRRPHDWNQEAHSLGRCRHNRHNLHHSEVTPVSVESAGALLIMTGRGAAAWARVRGGVSGRVSATTPRVSPPTGRRAAGCRREETDLSTHAPDANPNPAPGTGGPPGAAGTGRARAWPAALAAGLLAAALTGAAGEVTVNWFSPEGDLTLGPMQGGGLSHESVNRTLVKNAALTYGAQ